MIAEIISQGTAVILVLIVCLVVVVALMMTRDRSSKEFVTRIEFNDFKGEVRQDITDMKQLWKEAVIKIEERDKALSEKIEKVGKTAYEGRKGIHRDLNETRERLSVVEDRTKNES